MNNIRAQAGAVLLIITAIIVFGKSMALLHGRTTLTAFLTPSWSGLATTNPSAFAWILVLGTLALGKPFITFIENL